MIKCSVRVVKEDGSPVKGTAVKINWQGFLRGTSTEFTNNSGWAYFKVEKGGRADIYLPSYDNEGVDDAWVENGETFSITV